MLPLRTGRQEMPKAIGRIVLEGCSRRVYHVIMLCRSDVFIWNLMCKIFRNELPDSIDLVADLRRLCLSPCNN